MQRRIMKQPYITLPSLSSKGVLVLFHTFLACCKFIVFFYKEDTLFLYKLYKGIYRPSEGMSWVTMVFEGPPLWINLTSMLFCNTATLQVS